MNKTRTPLGQLMKLMDLVRRQIEKKDVPSASTEETAEDMPLIARLMKQGFRMEEIETAMKWLSLMSLTVAGKGVTGLSEPPDPHDAGSGPAAPGWRGPAGPVVEKPSTDVIDHAKSGGVRQLHSSEAIRLTPEAQQHLLGVLERGEITPLHFERAIEYLWRHDLREVTPTRLELILYMNDPQTQSQPQANVAPGTTAMFSNKVNPPVFIN